MRTRRTPAPLALLMLVQALRDTALPGHPSTWLELSVVEKMEDEDKENVSASGMADADMSALCDTAVMSCPVTWLSI